MIPRCMAGKTHKPDYLIEIYRAGFENEEQDVIRWCSECGAVVVDGEYDGRRMKEVIPMKFSNTLLDLIK